MREVILRLEQDFLPKQEDLDILESYETKNIFPNIVFDFTELGFNDIGMSIILTFALKNKAEGRKFSYKFNKQAAQDKDMLVYLKYFGFLKLLFDENYILNPIYENNIPYTKFTYKDIRSFLELIVRKWIKTHLKNKKGDIEPLLMAILEACNNIKDHSEAAYGLFMAFHNPIKNELRFCISDTGGGIPKKIKSNLL